MPQKGIYCWAWNQITLQIIFNLFLFWQNLQKGLTQFYLIKEEDHIQPKISFTLSANFGQSILPLVNEYWKPQFYLIYGRCFTFNLPAWLRDLKIIDITMELNIDGFIFLHHPGQYSSTDTKSKIQGKVGKNLFIDVGHDVG